MGVGSGNFGSASSVPDMTDDPEYKTWVESMAKHCRCSHDCPCAGVLDDEETPGERYDREVYGDPWHTPMSL